MINLGSLGIRSLLIGGLLAATSALANTATLYNTINDGIIDQRGGEFRAVTSNHGTFFTFCLERPVHVGMNTLYTYDVRPRAYGANRDLHDPTGLDGDPVSKGTAYLYELFSKGLLQSANGVGLYWDDHDRNAGLLQQAFWTLEDEFNYVGNPYVALVKSIFGDEGAYETYTGKNVQVMNLWGKNGQDIQSQLIYLPSIPSVPDAGATALLVALGVVGLGAVRQGRTVAKA